MLFHQIFVNFISILTPFGLEECTDADQMLLFYVQIYHLCKNMLKLVLFSFVFFWKINVG